MPIVEICGFDPHSLDFQSSAFTRLASSPYVLEVGLEPTRVIDSKSIYYANSLLTYSSNCNSCQIWTYTKQGLNLMPLQVGPRSHLRRVEVSIPRLLHRVPVFKTGCLGVGVLSNCWDIKIWTQTPRFKFWCANQLHHISMCGDSKHRTYYLGFYRPVSSKWLSPICIA